MLPTVVAERGNVITMMGKDVVLRFTVGDDAKPRVHKENITVTFRRKPLSSGGRVSLQINESVILVAITSLVSTDVGVYAVTVKTSAGSSTATTWLGFPGEGNGLC